MALSAVLGALLAFAIAGKQEHEGDPSSAPSALGAPETAGIPSGSAPASAEHAIGASPKPPSERKLGAQPSITQAPAPARYLEIVSTSGAAIQGAELVAVPMGSRCIEARSLVKFPASSDARGILTLHESTHRGPSDFGVLAKGFCSTLLERLPEIGETQRVVLQPAQDATVIVRDLQGRAIPGISVALSRWMTRPAELRSFANVEQIAGLEPETAIHIAKTDAEGLASFHALHAGQYVIYTIAPGYSIASAEQSLIVPGDPCSIVLAPILAAVIRASSDQIVSWLVTPRGQLPAASYAAALDLREVERSLRASHPEAIVIAACGEYGTHAEMQVKALLQKGGIVESTVALRPLADGLQVSEIGSPIGSASPFPLRKIRVTVTDPKGRTVPMGRLYLHPADSKMKDLPIVVEPGRELDVPLGNYGISAQPMSYNSLLAKRNLEITADSDPEITIPLSVAVQACRLVLTNPAGLPLPSASVEIRSGTFHLQGQYEDLPSTQMILPIGECSMTIVAAGANVATNAIIVEKPMNELLELRLSLAPNRARKTEGSFRR